MSSIVRAPAKTGNDRSRRIIVSSTDDTNGRGFVLVVCLLNVCPVWEQISSLVTDPVLWTFRMHQL